MLICKLSIWGNLAMIVVNAAQTNSPKHGCSGGHLVFMLDKQRCITCSISVGIGTC